MKLIIYVSTRFSGDGMRISSYLIERAIGKELKVEPERADLSIKKAKSVWRELPEFSAVPYDVAGIDGSLNYKEFVGYVIFAVGSAGVVYKKGKELEEHFLTEVDALKPSEFHESRLKLLMGTLEFKMAVRLVPTLDFVILDGSLIGSIVRPVVFNYELENGVKEWIEDLFLRDLLPSFSLDALNAREFFPQVAKKFSGKEFAAACGYLEYLEYLFSISRLLEQASEKVISVAKRSDSRIYALDTVLPDIYVFNSLEIPEGYSTAVVVPISKEKKQKFPLFFEDVLREFSFNVFYFKISGGSALKIESTADQESVLRVLRFYSVVKGYPLPLREVHRRVKITGDDMDRVLSIVKHRGISGREALE